MKNPLNIHPDLTIQFLNVIEFTKYLEKHPKIEKYVQAEFYKFLKYKTKEQVHIVIANREIPEAGNIHRDDSWKRRKELTKVIEELEEERATVSRVITLKGFRKKILGIINQSYQEAFEKQKSRGALLSLFYKNSQKQFDEIIECFASGEDTYEVNRYADLGVFDEQYSHIRHFGWIYWQQIQVVLKLLQEKEGIIRIVDLGAGGCNFIVSVARYLKRIGQLNRVHFIAIDRSDRDMQYGRKLIRIMKDTKVEFVVDDVTSNGFAHRLINWEPDLIVSNHLLEHLPGELKNNYLHDWLLATRNTLSISVPLKDVLEESLSEHLHYFESKDIKELAEKMELRVGYAIRVEQLDYLKKGGLIHFRKTLSLRNSGGLSNYYFSLVPGEEHVEPSDYYDDFKDTFDINRFKNRKRAVKIATIKDQSTFARKGDFPRQIRQLLIKMKGTDIRVPANFEQLTEAIKIIIDHNKAINPDFDASYMYLNLFRGITEFSSYRGLSLTPHGDQLQGLNERYWYKSDYSYIVSSTLPTIFWDQAFDFSEAMKDFKQGKRVNLYDHMSAQIKKENQYRSENFGIYLLSPYIVHSASQAEEEVFRVFMKIAISTKRFYDNRELRRNPAFDIEDWYLQETIGQSDGWLQHGHFNERFLKEDVIKVKNQEILSMKISNNDLECRINQSILK